MSLLYKMIFNSKCRSTHHRIAIDALRYLKSPNTEKWVNVFLKNYDTYLDGSKAPDTKFKDFRNHVLHVRDNYWGGAVKKANEWYEIALDELKARRWRDFAYATGVLSHYFTDPMMPFHTAQSERESVIHRAAEWSVTKSYCALQNILETDLGGYPEVALPEGDNWLEDLIKAGAELANSHYDIIIDHYDFDQGRKNPPAGLDQECKDRVAEMIGVSVVGFARVVDKLVEEAEVRPPMTPAPAIAFLESLTIPIYWVLKTFDDAKDRNAVQAMWNELQATGRVIESLPEDDKCVRAMHAKEVLKTTVEKLNDQKPGATGTKHGTGAVARRTSQQPLLTPNWKKQTSPETNDRSDTTNPPQQQAVSKTENKSAPYTPKPAPSANSPDTNRPSQTVAQASKAEPQSDHNDSSLQFYLEHSSPIVDAPSIGPKTAGRLRKIGIHRVSDLLGVDSQLAATRLANRHIDKDTVDEWKTLSQLMCRIPNLRGHDAQVLVACEYDTVDKIANADFSTLQEEVLTLMTTSAGERIIRSGAEPDEAELRNWISWAKQSPDMKKAA